jgi:translation initiation factor 1
MQRKKAPIPPCAAPFNNPFGALATRLGTAAQVPDSIAEPSIPSPPYLPTKAVVRFERKGHGGKEVTFVEQLGIDRDQLETWLREIKTLLGCGGTVAGEALVLQGDQRSRLKTWLEGRGVKRVRISG